MEIMWLMILNIMKILQFGRHQEVNVCVKLLMLCYHGGYHWLDSHVTVDPALIHLITRLSMQGPDPHQFYSGKTSDCSLVQQIKEAYSDVEKGKRGYKVASIQDGAVRLSYQMIAGNLFRKNRPMEVTGFIVDLAGKCVKGMQMNWASYLVNELEKDYRKVQDQGYEFHFSRLLILIKFVTWEMSEGVAFPEFEPSEPVVARFTKLWYASDMEKQWKSNAVFHAYYLQLKCAIKSFPQMTLNTFHTYRTLAKFHADCHFIYITVCQDISKEELQSYYKLINEYMEEITKEWLTKFLVPVEKTELSNPDIIGSPLVTRMEYDGPSSTKKKNKKEEVKDIDSEGKDSASKETAPDSPGGGGGNEVNQEEEGEEDKQEKGELTLPKDPLKKAETSKKMKVSLNKPSARKKSQANKPQSQNVLTVHDVDLIITAIEYALEGIL
jgi:hypothetical protein